MVEEVKKWKAIDGSLHDSLEAAKKVDYISWYGDCFECPKCKGSGIVNGNATTKSVIDRDATGYRGWHGSPVMRDEFVKWDRVKCEICNGCGYTQTELKAKYVTRRDFVGYVEASEEDEDE